MLPSSSSSSSSSPLLNQILASLGQSKNQFLLIEDYVSSDSKQLLTYWLRSHQKQQPQQQVLYWSYDLNDPIAKQLQLKNDSAKPARTQLDAYQRSGANLTIINSLNSMAIQTGQTYQELMQYLRKLIELQNCCFMAVLHLDSLVDCGNDSDVPVQRLFRMLASSVIRFCPDGAVEKINSCGTLVKCTIRKRDGRVDKRLERFEIRADVLKSEVVRELLVESETKRQPATMPSSTFNLELSERERDAKARVELPFWRKQQPETETGTISYEPDENDDWDYEDPDDDLDI